MHAQKTNFTTLDGLIVYDLSPQASDLWAVAGPDGVDPETIDFESLPSGFRWVDSEEWEKLNESQSSKEIRIAYSIAAEDARGGSPSDAELGWEFATLEEAKRAAWEWVHNFDDGQRRFFTVWIDRMELDQDGSGIGRGVCEIDTHTGEPIK